MPQAEQEQFVYTFTDNFLAGYEQAYALDPAWLDHIALFMKYQRTLIYIAMPKNVNNNTWVANTVRDLRPIILNDLPPVTGLD